MQRMLPTLRPHPLLEAARQAEDAAFRDKWSIDERTYGKQDPDSLKERRKAARRLEEARKEVSRLLSTPAPALSAQDRRDADLALRDDAIHEARAHLHIAAGSRTADTPDFPAMQFHVKMFADLTKAAVALNSLLPEREAEVAADAGKTDEVTQITIEHIFPGEKA